MKLFQRAMVAGALLSFAAVALPRASAAGLPYRDPALSPQVRARDLVRRMTLEEKIGQMALVYMIFLQADDDVATYNLGALFGSEIPSPQTPLAWAALANRYQRVAVEKTRLGIPIIMGTDAIHGNALLRGAVVFPHRIGMGATWNPALVERFAHTAALEMRAAGIRWTFSPIIDVVRDDRWGRTYECYGEDPYLASILGAREINGYQGADLAAEGAVAACAKHYIGSGASIDGVSAGQVVQPLWALREIHIEPFQYAVRAGVQSAMVTFSTVNGTMMHANHALTTGVLKTEMAFPGFVMSDWAGIDQVDPDYSTALERSIGSGLDMAIVPDDYIRYRAYLKDLVLTDRLWLSRIEDAAYRILVDKFRLGLFETPYVDEASTWVIGSRLHRDVARRAVGESLVILKNDGVLPIARDASIFVTGPSADDIVRQCGGWTVGWQRAEYPPPGTTILRAIRKAASGRVTFSEDGTGAAGHDVAIVVVGEEPYAELPGDTLDLDLPEDQLALIDEVERSGTPVVVVMVAGRPRTGLGSRLPGWKGFVMAWLPGTEGNGVADVLFGEVDASGRVPVTWPKSTSQEPINYDVRPGEPYDPLFEFGFGLGYTTFAYSDLRVDPLEGLTFADTIAVSLDVTNTGGRAGDEVVQVYVSGVPGPRPAPVKKLVRFEKVTIRPGEKRTVVFTIPVAELALFTDGPERVLNEGRLRLSAGGLEASFGVLAGEGTSPATTFTPSSWDPDPEPSPPVGPGSGTGLTAAYYTSLGTDRFHTLVKTVVDPAIDFDPFAPKLVAETGRSDQTAVRWSGWVEPRYSESTTFYVRVDDGARLWVDGMLLVDGWKDQSGAEYYNTLSLSAGAKMRIEMEYYNGTMGAAAQLFWSSLSIPRQVIPSTQLYPDVSFRRGDCNDDAGVNISDAVCILNWLFTGGKAPGCLTVADIDADGAANITDPLYLLNHLFLGGPEPALPFPDCGPEQLPGGEEPALGCESPPASCP